MVLDNNKRRCVMTKKTLLTAMAALAAGLVWAVAQAETTTDAAAAKPAVCAAKKCTCDEACKKACAENGACTEACKKACAAACAKKADGKAACATADKKACAAAAKSCPKAEAKAKADDCCKAAATKDDAAPAK